MTQAYSKGQKRKNKRGRVKDLYDEFEREAQPVREPEEPALLAPMQARANALGVEPTDEVLAPYLETEAGKVLFIAVKNKDERRDLFNTFNEYDRAHTLYMSRVAGIRMFPAVSKMEFMPERLEASASDVIDLRTTEEKADAAKKRMAEWDSLFLQLHTWDANILKSVSYRQETLVDRGEITSAGRSFVAAIRRLHQLSERK